METKPSKLKIQNQLFNRICFDFDKGLMDLYNVIIQNGRLIFDNLIFEQDLSLISNNSSDLKITFGKNCEIYNCSIQNSLSELNIFCDANELFINNQISFLKIESNIKNIFLDKESEINNFSFEGQSKKFQNFGHLTSTNLSGNIETIKLNEILGSINFRGNTKILKLNGKCSNFINFGNIETLDLNGEFDYLESFGRIFFLTSTALINDLKIKGKLRKFLNSGIVKKLTIYEKVFDFSDIGESSIITVNEMAYIHKFQTKSKGIEKVLLYGNFNRIHFLGKIGFIDFSGNASLIKFSASSRIFVLKGKSKHTCFYKGRIEKVIVNGNKFNNSIELNNCEIEDSFEIENSTINTFEINRTHGSEINVQLFQNQINYLLIEDSFFRENDLIKINFCQIENFRILNSNNLGSIFISNLKPISKIKNGQVFSLINSSLGKTQFIHCGLSLYDCFSYNNSKILDCFIADTTFPSEKNLKLDDGTDIVGFEQKRLFFSQIKRIFENQGDTVKAGEARAQELESYRKQLKYEIKSTTNFLNGLVLKEVWEKRKTLFILCVNRLSNYYGNNWLRATLMTFLVTTFCYSFYLFLVGYCPGKDVDKFWELSSYTLSYLNPFRDEDTSTLLEVFERDARSGFLNGKALEENLIYSIPPRARIWDHISRILVIFMVYQTIAAFRRLGKSN